MEQNCLHINEQCTHFTQHVSMSPKNKADISDLSWTSPHMHIFTSHHWVNPAVLPNLREAALMMATGLILNLDTM